MATTLDRSLSVLNALVGDYLERRGNALAIRMTLAHAGVPLRCEREALATAWPAATDRLVVLVHGLGMDEACWTYRGDPARSYGALLAEDLGYTPVHVRYNTGLALVENGRLLDELLEELVRALPVQPRELVLMGHSMGGLVLRRACHAAGLAGRTWLRLVRHAFYLGSPHLGAPLEKLGGVVTSVLKGVGIAHTDLVADVIDLRSRGIKDLGRGLAPAGDGTPLPLAPGVAHHFLVGGLGPTQAHVATVLLGDAMVRVSSASARHPGDALAPVDVRFFPGVGHLALARDPEVYTWIKRSLSSEPPAETNP
ncbi:MAG TPA: alpha/beta fold hydrolase [Anaeromyxobacteraceae bacterium]|nr:alpha/beta fold hydrolase [Anaeromyxobacteraceae bacterium]